MNAATAHSEASHPSADCYQPDGRVQLALCLAELEAQHLPVLQLLTSALREAPLPGEHPATALTWRIHQRAQTWSRAPEQHTDWRQWAEALNPGLTKSAQWPTIHSLLKSLSTLADSEALQQRIEHKLPHEVRAALMRLHQNTTALTPLSSSAREHLGLAPRRTPTCVRR